MSSPILRKVICSASLLIAVLVPTVGASPAQAQPEPTARAAAAAPGRAIEGFTPRRAAFECTLGYFCVWREYNGTGQKCSWDVSDPNWYSGTITCSWASYGAVRSIRNNGRYQDVRYFTGTNYSGSSGISVRGSQGNLPRAYILGSHYWYG